MLEKLNKINEMSGEMNYLINKSTSEPSIANANAMLRKMESIQSWMNEIIPRAELFEEEVFYLNDDAWPMPDTVRTEKLGKIEHSIIEQIERIDKKMTTGFKYQSYNKLLSKKIQIVNNVVDSCIKNLTDKLWYRYYRTSHKSIAHADHFFFFLPPFFFFFFFFFFFLRFFRSFLKSSITYLFASTPNSISNLGFPSFIKVMNFIAEVLYSPFPSIFK